MLFDLLQKKKKILQYSQDNVVQDFGKSTLSSCSYTNIFGI